MTSCDLTFPSTSTSTSTVGRPAPMRWGAAIALHLAPGVALLLFFLATAPVLARAGFPPVWGLLVGTLVVLIPVELGLVCRSLGGDGVRGLRAGLGLRRPRRGDLPALLLAAAGCLLAPGLVVWAEPLLREGAFGWLPEWFSAGTGSLSTFPAGVRVATVVLWLVAAVGAGPVVEEIYFRGWLLPRLPGSTSLRVTANAGLFAAYHLWQPQAVLTVCAFTLPLAVLVQRRGNPVLSMVVHCGVNLVLLGGLLLGALQR